MKRAALALVSIASVGAMVGSCGSSSKDVDAHVSDGTKPIDSKAFLDAPKVFMDAPPNTTPLTVKNFDNWCTVTEDGHAIGDTAANVTPGTITLVAKANMGFQLGTDMWHDTAGDTGAGDTGTVAGTGSNATSTTTVVVGTTAACVWVCCPFTGGGSGCNPWHRCTHRAAVSVAFA